MSAAPKSGKTYSLRKVKGMTERERRFAEEFVVDFSAADAARRAGFAENSASRYGPLLLGRPDIKNYVTEELAKKQQRTEITADRVLTEIGRIAFADATAIFDEHGNIKPHTEWPEDFRQAVKSMKFSEGRLVDVQMHDKASALEKAMKHLGMLTTKLQVEGTVQHTWTAMPEQLKKRLLDVTGVPVPEKDEMPVLDAKVEEVEPSDAD